ncbi:hypothetical protein B2G71_07415 [Novosphingobium sp. PC22D]|uniref:hypothetical protein n=1 Tax=Novosphingobium sp. PC22D TaxID=1962403 RepID=UPI000BF1BA1E|nr:hypothetical protein [Novosphingobium sp. PC22D]PEQ13261.1 hypothetical protein B2G71_07415 [Novosphingobium sp. PC22D]
MSSNPTTYHGEPGDSVFDWNDSAELQRRGDSGVLRQFSTVRRGTVAELIEFVMDLPEDEQANYAIQKSGDARFEVGAIRAMARRSDFPKA